VYPDAVDFQRCQQVRQHRGVPALTWTDQHHQRQPGAVAQLVDLRGQAPTGAADRVISRLDPQIRVSGLSISLPGV